MKKYNWIVYSVAALLGLLILVFPAFWIKLVIFSVGLGAIAYGAYNLVSARKIFHDSMYETLILAKGIFSIIIGVIAVLFPLAFAATMWRAMVVIQVIYLIISAGLGFYSVSLLKDTEIDRKPYIFENLGLLLLAVILILIAPGKMGVFLVRLVGLALLVFGSVMITFQFLIGKTTVEVNASDVIIVDSEKTDEKADAKTEEKSE